MSGVWPQLAFAVFLPLGLLLLMVNARLLPDQVLIDWVALTKGAIGGEGWTELLYLFRQRFPESRACPGCLREVVGSALGGMRLLALMIMRLMMLINFPLAPTSVLA